MVLFVVLSPKSYGFEVRGHLKTVGFLQKSPAFPKSQGVLLRARVHLDHALSDDIALAGAYEVAGEQSAGRSLAEGAGESRYRVQDLKPLLGSQRERTFMQNLDRLYFSVRYGAFDVKLGRQPIGFGSGRLTQPSDVLAPFSFAALDTEHRAGVDALLVRYTVSDFSEVDGGYVAGEGGDIKKSAVYLKGRTLLWGTDVTLLWLQFYEHQLLSYDIQGALGGIGLWCEGAKVWLDDGMAYNRWVLGADYQFPDTDFYGFLEIHESEAGYHDPKDYGLSQSSLAFSEGGVELLGRQYWLLGFRYPLHPLVGFQASLTSHGGADQDRSQLFHSELQVDVGEDARLVAAYLQGVGKEEHEFGAWGRFLYASLRYYF